MSQDPKVIRRQKLRWRIRTKIHGTAQKPGFLYSAATRIFMCSLLTITMAYTLAAASSRDKDIAAAGGNKVAKSLNVGKAIAQKAKALGIEACVFDRGGYLYHGRVKSVADGAREGGLKF